MLFSLLLNSYLTFGNNFSHDNDELVKAWKAISDLPVTIRINIAILSKGDELMTLGFSKTQFRTLATLEEMGFSFLKKDLDEIRFQLEKKELLERKHWLLLNEIKLIKTKRNSSSNVI